MAYSAGTATSIADLFSKLDTFAQADGWTEDYTASDRLFLHKGTCYVAFRWDSGTPTCAGVYHALGFINSATAPGSHTSDSGQGAVSGTDATILAGRSVPLVNSTMPYWFFSGSSPDYIHVVAQVASGDFRHFGFGTLSKLGSWTGGEYAYGWHFGNTGGTSGLAVRGDNCMLLDALGGIATGTPGGTAPSVVQPFAASLHIEGLPNEGGSSKWALAWGGGTPAANDRGGNARYFVQGGFRGNSVASAFGRYSGTLLTGLVPLYSMRCHYKDPSNARYYPLGDQPDVRGVHMGAFVGSQEITVGVDTWTVFPAKALTSFSNTSCTRMQGIAYRKNP